MSEELKPCPFCGGEAELDTSQAYRALSGGTLGSRAAVYCARCGADMGFCYEDAPGTPREDIVNQVVDDWNRRVPSPDMREDAERLDWLESVNLRSNERNGTVYGWKYDINHNRAALTDHNLPALTIREAIDAARFPDRASVIVNQSAKEWRSRAAFDEKFPGVREKAFRSLTGAKP